MFEGIPAAERVWAAQAVDRRSAYDTEPHKWPVRTFDDKEPLPSQPEQRAPRRADYGPWRGPSPSLPTLSANSASGSKPRARAIAKIWIKLTGSPG